jgi:hypothetical protein
MKTTHARASLSREPRLSDWETTEKKSDTQTIARMIPTQPFADRMEPQAVRFRDIIS